VVAAAGMFLVCLALFAAPRPPSAASTATPITAPAVPARGDAEPPPERDVLDAPTATPHTAPTLASPAPTATLPPATLPAPVASTPAPPASPVAAPATPTRVVQPARPGAGVPILMYHYIRVNPDHRDTIGYGLSVPPDMFAAHIAFLAERGYRVVPMRD